MNHGTLIAGNYAKIAARFLGRYQPFVRPHSLENASIPAFYDMPNVDGMPINVKLSVRDFLTFKNTVQHLPSLQRMSLTTKNADRAPQSSTFPHIRAQHGALSRDANAAC